MGNPPLPYYTFAQYIRRQFKTKAFRISVDGFFGCTGRCVYCENSYYAPPEKSLEEQILSHADFYRNRYKARDFYLYFQKGTGTMASPGSLKKIYDRGLSVMDFLGLIIGTRPDYVDEDVMAVLDNYKEKYDLWLEYGLQSTHNRTLERIRRGHTYEDFTKALDLARRHQIKTTAHLIMGLPGEDPEMMFQSVRRLSRLPVSGVKFHHLYVLKGTELFQWYKDGRYTPLEYEEYAEILITALRYLREDIVVHRILGEDHSPQHAAPDWDRDKQSFIDDIKKRMALKGYRQGDLLD